MELSRRDFLKASGAGLGGAFLIGALKPGVVKAKVLPLKKKIGEKITICPYDGSGCGFIVDVENVSSVDCFSLALRDGDCCVHRFVFLSLLR